MRKIIILNGPNLNLLGEREKKQYGNFTLDDIEKMCKSFAKDNELDVSLFQTNIEGELVEKIQLSRNSNNGLIINAGGYTHTSVAIHDALKILNEREREIINARRLTENPKTLEELSKKFKISRERIRQIETKAFEKLQKSMINASKSKNLLPVN